MDANLVKRIAFAAVAIPAAFALVWLGGTPLAALVALIAALGTRELYGLAERGQIRPLQLWGMLSAAAVPLAVFHGMREGPPDAPAVGWVAAGLWVIATLALVLFTRAPGDRPLEAAAVTLLGVAYTGGLPSALLVIRDAYPDRDPDGIWLVFLPLVVTWVVDTAAMFGGRAMKGPKLWPAISPGKTWSGGIAGAAAGLVLTPVLVSLTLEPLGITLPLWQSLLFGLLLGVVGQVGDLAESLFKREAGVKDSSALIPGHGGVLDRFDSLYFVMPCAYALYRAFEVM
jgi:phosphatidate cytidylyltransferase